MTGITEKPPASDRSLLAAGGRNRLRDACVVLNEQGSVIEADEGILNWLATTKDQLRGKPFWPVLWHRYPNWEETVKELLASRCSFGRVELADRAEQPNQWFTLETAQGGGTRFVRFSSRPPLISERGEPGPDDILSSDDAERRMDLRLKRADAQLTNLARRWPGVIFSQRPDLSFQFVNDRIEEWTGISVAEWQRDSTRFQEVIHECDDKELQQQLERCAGMTGGSTATFRVRHVKTGRVTYVREQREALISPSGSVLGYEGSWMEDRKSVV